jgi:hypothetical protein
VDLLKKSDDILKMITVLGKGRKRETWGGRYYVEIFAMFTKNRINYEPVIT